MVNEACLFWFERIIGWVLLLVKLLVIFLVILFYHFYLIILHWWNLCWWNCWWYFWYIPIICLSKDCLIGQFVSSVVDGNASKISVIAVGPSEIVACQSSPHGEVDRLIPSNFILWGVIFVDHWPIPYQPRFQFIWAMKKTRLFRLYRGLYYPITCGFNRPIEGSL